MTETPSPTSQKATPALLWDWGAAYDLFISLRVLHNPGRFGVRGAWARGVRSRLTTDARTTLDETRRVMKIPFPWLFNLDVTGKFPEKNSLAILERLEKLPPADCMAALTVTGEMPAQAVALLLSVAHKGWWNEMDRQALFAAYTEVSQELEQELEDHLNWWSRPSEFCERTLAALRVYVDVFFVEEEQRITPALEASFHHGQALAETLPLTELLEELSQGLRFEEATLRPRLALVPSYWISPLAIISQIDTETGLLVYGGRPPEASLAPGESVPDGLYQPIKALADPTRLRILRYLAESPLTPTDLARRLRLRAPTVIHHLNTLRLAGLVYLTVEPQGERRVVAQRYAARLSRVRSMYEQLNLFLGQTLPQKDKK